MAGIGFELKKIFGNQTIISRIQGFSYATMVSAGPMIISIFMLVILGQLLKLAHVPIHDRELMNAAIMYAFIFAMILVSGPSIIASRYIADQVFLHKNTGILASLLGMLAISTGIGGIVGSIFLLRSPMTMVLKFLTYQLFIELIILYLLMVYISAVKDYKTVSAAFAAGIGLSLVLGMVLFTVGVPVMTAALSGIDLGFLVNIIILLRVVKRYFYHMSHDVFDFIGYIRHMPRLMLTNVFYNVSLFSHNIIFWLFSGMSIRLMDTYYYAQSYDIATFFAVLTILPATVIFVIKVETSFYEKYAAYIRAITQGGTLQEIDKTRVAMIQVLMRELTNIFESQFVISVILVLLGTRIFLPLLSMDTQTIELFSILCFGFFMTYMTFIIVTILLYFDNQADSFKITGLLWISTTTLTLLTLLLGENYYGLGFCLGALITLIFSIRKLMRTLNQIDYRIFSK